MAAARYWRIVGIEVEGGGDLELSELQLYDGGARVDGAATLTCSHAPVAGALLGLRDDNTATVCRFDASAVRSGGFALMWDFGTAQEVTGVRIGTGSAQALSVSMLVLEQFVGGAWTGFGRSGRYAFPGPNAMGPVPEVGDPTFANVALLLQADGPDGSTSFIDASPTPKTFSAVGGAALSTAKTVFGRAMIKLSGNGDSIEAAPDSTLIFGTGDFTIGFHAWKSANGRDGYDRVIHTSANIVDNDGFLVELSATRGLMMYGAGGFMLSPIAVNPNDSTLHYWEIDRKDGVMYAFKDGSLIGSNSNSTNITSAGQLRIGARLASGGDAYFFNGYLFGLFIKKGEALHTASFTAPTAPRPTGSGTVFAPPPMHTVAVSSTVAAAATVGAHTAPLAPGLQFARDVEYGGNGTIYGTTKTKGTPNLPTKARVVLLHQRSKLPVREAWSDPVTGYFEFRGIDISQQFLTLAEDAAGNFRPVAANRLTPEVLA